jgi:hypothetical protein
MRAVTDRAYSSASAARLTKVAAQPRVEILGERAVKKVLTPLMHSVKVSAGRCSLRDFEHRQMNDGWG